MSTAPETTEGRRQRLYDQNQALYSHHKPAKRPTTKHDLDVLKEHNRFIRDSTADRSQLSWEANLALKYYNTLFREFAIANLKHYKTGQIALRWRTEDEVLSGVGHLTCASLRCEHHRPLPELAARFEDEPEGEAPLVRVGLEEYEVPFGYVEDGERKDCLVKVVLCAEDARRLLQGRRRAKRDREEREGVVARREETTRRGEGSRSAADEGGRSDRRASSRLAGSSARQRSASPLRRRH